MTNFLMKYFCHNRALDKQIEDNVSVLVKDLTLNVENELLREDLENVQIKQSIKYDDENADMSIEHFQSNIYSTNECVIQQSVSTLPECKQELEGQGWKNLRRPPLTSIRDINDPRWPSDVPLRTRIEWFTADTDEDEEAEVAADEEEN